MTELLPGLYAVSVPEEASNFDLGKHYGSIAFDLNGYTNYYPLPDLSNYEIIGTVTADTIDFKTFNHVGICDIENISLFYKDYTNPTNKFDNPDDSFRSLLTSKGLHFVNPYGEKPKINVKQRGNKIYSIVGEIYAQWYQAEQNLVKKLEIIKKVK